MNRVDLFVGFTSSLVEKAVLHVFPGVLHVGERIKGRCQGSLSFFNIFSHKLSSMSSLGETSELMEITGAVKETPAAKLVSKSQKLGQLLMYIFLGTQSPWVSVNAWLEEEDEELGSGSTKLIRVPTFVSVAGGRSKPYQ